MKPSERAAALIPSVFEALKEQTRQRQGLSSAAFEKRVVQKMPEVMKSMVMEAQIACLYRIMDEEHEARLEFQRRVAEGNLDRGT